MFFNYNQNNSYGTFDFNKENGITHHVIIEADNNAEADSLAQEIGIYFEGIDREIDCSCCGNRWDRASDYNKSESPSVYGLKLDREIAPKIIVDNKRSVLFKWMGDDPEIFVHYKDGSKIAFYIKESDIVLIND